MFSSSIWPMFENDCAVVQDDFFWSTMPLPLEEADMPKFEASHELDMKRKRHADRGQRQEVRAFTLREIHTDGWIHSPCNIPHRGASLRGILAGDASAVRAFSAQRVSVL